MKCLTDRGYGLAELLVSMAIVGGTLVAAFGLIDHALRVFGETGASAGNPVTLAAEMSLRHDVQAAESLPDVGPQSEGALTLELQDGRRVEWRREGEALIRAQAGPGEQLVESRIVPRKLTGWGWQVLSPDLIEVRIGVESSGPAVGLHQSGPPQIKRTTSLWVAHIAPRGTGARMSW